MNWGRAKGDRAFMAGLEDLKGKSEKMQGPSSEKKGSRKKKMAWRGRGKKGEEDSSSLFTVRLS